MGNITDRQNIETNALQSKLAANNNALQFSLIRMGAENQGYLNSLALGTQVYNSITANQPAVNQNNVQPRSTDQYQDPYGFNGTQGYGMSNYTSNPYDFTANAAPTGAGPLLLGLILPKNSLITSLCSGFVISPPSSIK